MNTPIVREQDNIELVPSSGFTNGKLNPEGRAIAALNALPIEIEGLDLLEGGYRAWCAAHPWLYRLARVAFEDLRQQEVLLARRLTEEITQNKAQTVQASFYANYVKLNDDWRKVRSTMLEHYPAEIQAAEAGNRNLLDVVRELLVQAKNR